MDWANLVMECCREACTCVCVRSRLHSALLAVTGTVSGQLNYRSIPKGRPTGRTLRHKIWSVASPNWAALSVTQSNVVLEFCRSEPALRVMQSRVVLEFRRSRAALRVTVSKVAFEFRRSEPALCIRFQKLFRSFAAPRQRYASRHKVAATFFGVTRLV
jgi:hypothetical protein